MSTAKWLNEFNSRKILFERKFVRGRPQDCWPWDAAKIKKGHGIFNLGELTATGSTAAYVAAWFFYVEPNPNFFCKQFRFTHICGDPSCVNPGHLIKLGPNGLENYRTVLEYIANKNSFICNELLGVAAKL